MCLVSPLNQIINVLDSAFDRIKWGELCLLGLDVMRSCWLGDNQSMRTLLKLPGWVKHAHTALATFIESGSGCLAWGGPQHGQGITACFVAHNLECRSISTLTFWSSWDVSSSQLVIDGVWVLWSGSWVWHGSKIRDKLSSLAISRGVLLLHLVVQLLKVVKLGNGRGPFVVSGGVLATQGLQHVEVLGCSDGTVAAALCQSSCITDWRLNVKVYLRFNLSKFIWLSIGFLLLVNVELWGLHNFLFFL